MLLRTAAIKAVTEEITALFNSIDLPFFIGGSRRFGYDNNKSDIDIYVHIPLPSTDYGTDYGVYDNIINTLIAKGLEIDDESADYGGHAYKFMDLLHIVVLVSDVDFYALKDAHTDLEEYFTHNTPMLNLAKIMKSQGIGGSTIFRVFMNLIRNKEYL